MVQLDSPLGQWFSWREPHSLSENFTFLICTSGILPWSCLAQRVESVNSSVQYASKSDFPKHMGELALPSSASVSGFVRPRNHFLSLWEATAGEAGEAAIPMWCMQTVSGLTLRPTTAGLSVAPVNPFPWNFFSPKKLLPSVFTTAGAALSKPRPQTLSLFIWKPKQVWAERDNVIGTALSFPQQVVKKSTAQWMREPPPSPFTV